MLFGGLDGRAPVGDADGARDANFRAARDVFDDGSDNRTDGAEDGALAMGRGVIELEVVLCEYDPIESQFINALHSPKQGWLGTIPPLGHHIM